MAADGEFVEGWLVAQVLGEGAYGEVRLLVHAQSGSCVALKSVRAECADAAAAAAREAALHRALRHPHVLRCLGARTYQSMHYMFLEYAQGGELFDRIEPDVGMSVRGARRYWRQLLKGLEYLHGRGVAHRDIKPENLLLDSEDRLKISDFGMATVFRHAGRERLLSRVCGTVPYAAPEVLEAVARPYRAAPADLWAAAIVLYAMLVGELPWERAHVADRRYAVWCAQLAAAAAGDDAEAGGGGTGGAWRRVAGEARALLALALHPAPDARPSIETLLKHDWLKPEGEPPKTVAALTSRPWSSQPAPPACAELDASAATAIAPDELEVLACYSQPVIADDLLLSTQSERALTQSSQQGGVLARLVRRMTRIWVRVDEDTALHELCIVLRHKTYTWRHLHPRILAVECGPTVRMRVWAVRANNAPVMLEFRRSRGCGLEFKRRYLELRAALRSLAAPPPPHVDLLAAPPLYRAAAEPMDQS